MAIDFPTSHTDGLDGTFVLNSNTAIFTNPVSASIQRLRRPGSFWEATFTIPPRTQAQAADWRAFLVKLQGQFNTFNGFDPATVGNRGVATGTPLVNGNSQTGTALNTDGWTPTTTGILKTGDYFEVNGEYKIITEDINSDGSGNATLVFEPELRLSPIDGQAIEVSNPRCEMILTNSQVMWNTSGSSVVAIQFSGREIFDSTKILVTDAIEALVADTGEYLEVIV